MIQPYVRLPVGIGITADAGVIRKPVAVLPQLHILPILPSQLLIPLTLLLLLPSQLLTLPILPHQRLHQPPGPS